MTDVAAVGPHTGIEGRAEEQRSWPGDPDIWVFVVFEAFLFTAYFTVYVVCRSRNAALYLESGSELDLRVGTLNTLLLLASSWSVARCVRACRGESYRAARMHGCLTVLFGLGFVVCKILEWRAEIGRGFTFTTNEFFSFYYFFTALHFLHVLIGFVFLGVAGRQLFRPGRRSRLLVETGATYWHTVDFLWIMIFALLYVMR